MPRRCLRARASVRTAAASCFAAPSARGRGEARPITGRVHGRIAMHLADASVALHVGQRAQPTIKRLTVAGITVVTA